MHDTMKQCHVPQASLQVQETDPGSMGLCIRECCILSTVPGNANKNPYVNYVFLHSMYNHHVSFSGINLISRVVLEITLRGEASVTLRRYLPNRLTIYETSWGGSTPHERPIRRDSAQKGYLFQGSGIYTQRVGISHVALYERVGKSLI